MSCQHSYLIHPHTIATLATLLLLFSPQAWAAPHSNNLERRSGGTSGTTIAVRSHLTFVACFLAQQATHPLGSRHCCARFYHRRSNGFL